MKAPNDDPLHRESPRLTGPRRVTGAASSFPAVTQAVGAVMRDWPTTTSRRDAFVGIPRDAGGGPPADSDDRLPKGRGDRNGVAGLQKAFAAPGMTNHLPGRPTVTFLERSYGITQPHRDTDSALTSVVVILTVSKPSSYHDDDCSQIDIRHRSRRGGAWRLGFQRGCSFRGFIAEQMLTSLPFRRPPTNMRSSPSRWRRPACFVRRKS